MDTPPIIHRSLFIEYCNIMFFDIYMSSRLYVCLSHMPQENKGKK